MRNLNVEKAVPQIQKCFALKSLRLAYRHTRAFQTFGDPLVRARKLGGLK